MTPNKITAVLKVTATIEIYDDEASEETVRYIIEQVLEDDGFDVDVALLKDQEPKTGKWILDDDDANCWKCSECGGLQQIIDGTPYENGWYFCPHCGTKLEEQAVKFDD